MNEQDDCDDDEFDRWLETDPTLENDATPETNLG
jgi:hypothetical protein